MSWYLIPDGTVVYHTRRKRRGEMEKKKTKQKLLLLWERKLNVLLLFHYSTFFCMRCFLYILTLREKRLSWKNHSRRNPFVFLSFIFEFISLRGPYRRLEPTGREFPRSSCARGIHSVAAAKEFLIYVGLKHTHTRVQKTHVFYPPNTTFPLNFKFTFLALKWL